MWIICDGGVDMSSPRMKGENNKFFVSRKKYHANCFKGASKMNLILFDPK